MSLPISTPLISDKEIEALPHDSEAAFVQLDNLIRSRAIPEHTNQPDRRQEYAATIRAFVEEHKLKISLFDPAKDSSAYTTAFARFCSVVDEAKARFRFQRQRASTEGINLTLTLTAEEKKEIRAHLDAIRMIVENSGLSDRKKNAIFERIALLAKEIDKTGTRVDSMFAFWMDAAMFSAQATEYAKPFMEEVKGLLRIVYQAKARNEGVALPAPKNVPMLGKD